MNSTTMPTASIQKCLQKTGSNSVDVALSTFYSLTILSTVLGNILLVMTVLCSRHLREHTSNVFIVSLAFSDIVFGLLTLPTRLVMQYQCLSYTTCYVMLLLDVFSGVTLINNIVLIAVDRYIAIIHPYTYQRFMTHRRSLMIVFGLWTYGVIWALLSNLNWDSGKRETLDLFQKIGVCSKYDKTFAIAEMAFVIVLPLCISGVAYCRVLIVALSQVRSIRAVTGKFDIDRDLDSRVVSTHQTELQEHTAHETNQHSVCKAQPYPAQLQNNTETKRRKMSSSVTKNLKELKITLTLLVVYAVFFLCWFPLGIYILLAQACGASCSIKNKAGEFYVYLIFGVILPPFSTSIHPFIYGLMNRQFRNGLRRLISLACSCNRPR